MLLGHGVDDVELGFEISRITCHVNGLAPELLR